MLVCDSAVNPIGQCYDSSAMLDYVQKHVKRVIIVSGQPIKDKYPKMLNVAILGVAAQNGIFPFDAELFNEVIPEMIPERFWAMNIEAFAMGRKLNQSQN